MARNLGETTVTVPVLDRLIDLEPGSQTENPPSRSQSERLLKRAVRRDLEWLLNTRRISDLPDEGLKEVNRSGYMYGLPDLSALTMATSGDRNKLVRQIRGGHQSLRAAAGQRSPDVGRNTLTQRRAKYVCASRPCCAWTRRLNLSPSIPSSS